MNQQELDINADIIKSYKKYRDGIKVQHYLFGLICISANVGVVDLNWMKIEKDHGDYYCYFQYTLPFVLIIGVSMYSLTINIRKPKLKWQS